jgi:GntR family transcriptional regulator
MSGRCVIVSGSQNAKQPKYKQIADDLRAAITAGEYGPGDRIPGENVLSADYGVAVMTVRQAMTTLKNEGLVEARKGAGVFVRSFKPIRRRGIQRLARDQWGSGRSIWSTDESREVIVDQISVTEEPPPQRISRTLGLTEGDAVCVRSRRFLVAGRPVMLATSYLSSALVAGSPITQQDTGPGGTYARLADLGHGPVHYQEEVRARMPSTEEAKRLSMAGSSPVITVARTAFNADRQAVEVNEMTMDAASYVLDYEFDA